MVVVVVVAGVVVVDVGVVEEPSSEGATLLEDGALAGAAAFPAFLTLTETFIPPEQCPGVAHMK